MSTQAVGLSTHLAPKQVMRARLNCADLAIWRSASGVISAWENRCPHRGMRLSHGFVRGESLACAYHGWHYGCDGACNKIPAHPELEPPESIRVKSFSVQEHRGIVWVNTIDAVQPVSLPENLSAVRSLTINSDPGSVVKVFSSFPQLAETSNLRLNTTVSENPLVLSFSDDSNSDCVLIAFQQSGPQTTVCHVLAINTLKDVELVSVSRWCESVRRVSEKAAAQTTEKSAEQTTTDSDGSD